MRRRLLITLLSLSVAAAGTWLVLRAAASEHDAALEAARSTSVLVATERIEPGTTAAEARTSVTRAEVPAAALVPGVLTDLGSVARQRAVGPILPGQQIVAGQWGEAEVSPLRPPLGTIGLAVQLGDPQRVAGFVTPGSQVALFATIASGAEGSRTRLLLSPVTVLGVGSSTLTTRTTATEGETSTEQVPSAILTLALTPSQAERVVYAVTEGQLYLGLLGDKVRIIDSGGVTGTSLFAGAS